MSMIRNILLIIWFCITGLTGLVILLIKELPKICENLRIEAEKIEQASKDAREQQRRKTKY